MTSDMTSTNRSVDKGYRGASSSDSGKRKKLFSADFALAVTYALINLLVLLFCRNVVGVQADESLNIYGALRLLEGEKIYQDFWVYHPPGIFLLTAGVFTLFGKSLIAIRLVLFAAASITTSVLYLMGRRFMGKTASLVAPTLFVLIGVNLWPVAGYHWYSTFVPIWSAFFVVRFVTEPARKWSLFIGGFLAGATFLFYQPKGGLFISLVLLFLLADGFMKLKKPGDFKAAVEPALIFSGAVALVLMVTAGWLFLTNALREAVAAAIVYPLKTLSETSSQEGDYLAFYGYQTSRSLEFMIRSARFTYMASGTAKIAAFTMKYAVPFSIPVAIILSAVRRRRGNGKSSSASLCSLAAAAIFLSSLQKPDYLHLLTVLPPCFLCLAYLLDSIATMIDRIKIPFGKRALIISITAILFYPLIAVAIGTFALAKQVYPLPLQSPLGFIPMLRERETHSASPAILRVVDFIQMNTRPDDPIFVMSYSPFIYYLSERKNPTPFIDIPSSPCATGAAFHMLKLGEVSPLNRERLVRAARDVDASKTPLIVVDPAASCQITGNLREVAFASDPLVNYILRHYRVRAEYGDFVVMMRSE